MNLFRRLLTILLATTLAPLSAGQDQATTLLAACRNADVVVRATVLGASDPSPDFHRLEFRSDEVLKGQVGARFPLMEPSGACCGRLLFTLVPGDTCLLFLKRTGPLLHPFGGGRGVAVPTDDLLAHVRALLAPTDDAAVANLLAASLQAPEPRVAHDAALALAGLPTVTLADGPRASFDRTLAHAVAEGRTTAPSLCELAVRLGDTAVIDTLLPHYLAAAHADRRELLRRTLLRLPAGEVGNRLPMFLDPAGADAVRGAELLVGMPDAEAQSGLERLLQQNSHPRIQLCLAEVSLRSSGRAAQLGNATPSAVTTVAEQRRRTQKSFRAIRPGQP